MRIVERDLAYTAGIIDGEGYIGIGRAGNGRGHHLTTTVMMYHKEVPEYLNNLFGGSLRQYGRYWCWRVYNKKAGVFLRLVAPYIFLKRKQVELALQFCDTLLGKGGSPPGRRGNAPITDECLAQREFLTNQIKGANTYA